MKITPLDIRKQTFKKQFRGIDPEEVQAFLEMIAEEFERLNSENIQLTERHRTLQTTLDRYRELERTLQETPRTAQKAADDVHDNAKKEARLTVKEAEIRGNRAIEKARHQVQSIRNEIVDLKNQRDQFVSRLQALIQAQSDTLAQVSFTDPPVVDEGLEPDGGDNGHSAVSVRDDQED